MSLYSHIPLQLLDGPTRAVVLNQIEKNNEHIAMLEGELGRQLTPEEEERAFHRCDSFCNCESIL